jgi:hypothetical protein
MPVRLSANMEPLGFRWKMIFLKFVFRNITKTCGKNVSFVKIGEK